MKKILAIMLAMMVILGSIACAETASREELLEYYLSEANEVVVTDTQVIFTDDTDRGEIAIDKNPKKVAVLFGSIACLWYEAGGTIQLAVGGESPVALYEQQIGRDFTKDEGVTVVAESSGGQTWDLEVILSSMDCEVPLPQPLPEDGFYMPEGILAEHEALALKAQAAEGTKPVVGLILHQTHIMNNNTRHIDAVLRELRGMDVVALPLFTRMANDEDDKRGVRHAMERYFMHDGKRLPDVLMVMTGFSMTHMSWPGNGQTEQTESLFAGWDIPALQVMATRLTLEDYRKKPQGMDSMSLNTNIFQPELDGQIMTVPCAATQVLSDEGASRKVFEPMQDRVRRVCEMAVSWAKLRRTPNSEKKIAILFHTMPGDDRIGETVPNFV